MDSNNVNIKKTHQNIAEKAVRQELICMKNIVKVCEILFSIMSIPLVYNIDWCNDWY